MSKISSLFNQKREKIYDEYFGGKIPSEIKVHFDYIGKELKSVKQEEYTDSNLPLVIVIPITEHAKTLEGLDQNISECFKKIPNKIHAYPYAIIGIGFGLEYRGMRLVIARGKIINGKKRPLDITETVNLMKIIPFAIESDESLSPCNFFTNNKGESDPYTPIFYRSKNNTYGALVVKISNLHENWPRNAVPYCARTIMKKN